MSSNFLNYDFVWETRDEVSGSSLPLIFCIHLSSGPIFWGGYLPCKKDYKGDGNLHVKNMKILSVMVFYM